MLYLRKTMKSPTLKSHDVVLLIDNAREAEMCRDLDLLSGLLSKVWENSDLDPDYSYFAPEINAELLRLSGICISQRGRSRGLVDQQVRAKDILTRAADIFANIGDREKTAEANIALAVCYWFSGEVEECNVVLSSLETEFNQNQGIYLKIQLNRIGCLSWQRNYEQAITIINLINDCVEDFPDQKLQAQFYNNAGLTYHYVGENEKAINYGLKAVDISRLIESDRFLGLNLNCLALFCREINDFTSAHLYAEEAISVFESIGDAGWVPHVLDTRALIFLDEGRFDEALETINKAVALFSESEDYSGLTEAMFTKCRCLLRLRREAEAFALFSELGHIASVRIGETALRKYSAQLAEEVRFIDGKTFRERTDFLKENLIREALRASGGNIGEAAQALGESHQALSFMLKSKYPGLYEEFGIARKPRTAAPRAKRPKSTEPQIRHVLMPPSMKYAYDFHIDETPDISTFLVSAELAGKLGLKGSKLVAVAKMKEPKPGVTVLYEADDVYDTGRLIYDNLTGLFVIEKGEDDFVFFTDVSLLGVPIGYCDTGSVNRNMLEFRRI